MNTYPTLIQATNAARTLSMHWGCAVVVYETADEKFAAAKMDDPIRGEIQGVYRDGYAVRTVLTRT